MSDHNCKTVESRKHHTRVDFNNATRELLKFLRIMLCG